VWSRCAIIISYDPILNRDAERLRGHAQVLFQVGEGENHHITIELGQVDQLRDDLT